MKKENAEEIPGIGSPGMTARISYRFYRLTTYRTVMPLTNYLVNKALISIGLSI